MPHAESTKNAAVPNKSKGLSKKKKFTTNHTNITNFLHISCRCSCWFAWFVVNFKLIGHRRQCDPRVFPARNFSCLGNKSLGIHRPTHTVNYPQKYLAYSIFYNYFMRFIVKNSPCLAKDYLKFHSKFNII